VLRVAADRTISVNGTAVAYDDLAERLKRMFAARDDHILFFDAEDDTEYGYSRGDGSSPRRRGRHHRGAHVGDSATVAGGRRARSSIARASRSQGRRFTQSRHAFTRF